MIFLFFYTDLPPPEFYGTPGILLFIIQLNFMKAKKHSLLIIFLFLLLVCCQKKISQPPAPAPPPRDSIKNSDLIARLAREVADVLELVYQNQAAYREILAAIYSAYYADERVLLEDLLHPSTSVLYKGVNCDTGIFRKTFCEIIERDSFPLLRQLVMGSGGNAARIDGSPQIIAMPPIAVYFPYSENFSELRLGRSLLRTPTIVAAGADTNQGIGRAPFSCPGTFLRTCYREVKVDDDYASQNPTHIVTVGAEPQPPQYEPPKANGVNRVYCGWARLTSQMDRLISLTGNGGGSEIKICRINGYLKTQNAQVDNFTGDLVTLHFTRSDIRNHNWKRVYTVWDPNWNYQDVEQVLAVYEEDTKGESNFSGSLTTTLALPGRPSTAKVVGEIGFKISVVTQDEIITQRNIDRNSYFKTEGRDQGWGFMKETNDFLPSALDWPVYDGGAVWAYTMPYQVY